MAGGELGLRSGGRRWPVAGQIEKAAWWAAFSAYRNLMEGGETAFLPLFLGYQVGVENTPNLFGGFGVEVFCFFGSLLWSFGLGLDKFSTEGGKDDEPMQLGSEPEIVLEEFAGGEVS